ncbi:hypothetical protein ABL78_5778 [Leptomonas seymouri]|uniref:Uncharacterized protein n=1 Tax=Leptomonas seymouri TaxID=5684 RepID=A0A0N1IIX8_LEPSE|nr:hypothetical protein ABL78_5778 [Leptomonas seymouri]|eukprot:KPI85153.1 hypothetical protein ABL78_5778 [Leptomonas seymouri]
MPIPSVKSVPPPPRRAPPAAAPATLVRNASADAYTATYLQLKLSGIATTLQQLIQTKDSVNDIKMALATADDTIQRVTANPSLLGSAAADNGNGGVDIRSLEFAASTRAKLADQELKQDAYYAQLSESASVAQEMRTAANDPSLRSCREEMNCLLAASTFADARHPAGQGVSRRIPPEEHQTLLNPFEAVRRKSKSSALTTSLPANASSSSNNTAPLLSSGPSPLSGAATAPPGPHVNKSVPTVYSSNNSVSMGGAGVSVVPANASSGCYRPWPPSLPPIVQQPYGGTPGLVRGSGYPGASPYLPTATVAPMAGAYPMLGNAGFSGASPYPHQGQQQPIYGQYGQRPPMANQQGNAWPTYTAL